MYFCKLFLKPYIFLFTCSKQLRIQSHFSILHVEQEVAGDETRAVDSVLECDELRSRLLKEERELNEKIHSTR